MLLTRGPTDDARNRSIFAVRRFACAHGPARRPALTYGSRRGEAKNSTNEMEHDSGAAPRAPKRRRRVAAGTAVDRRLLLPRPDARLRQRGLPAATRPSERPAFRAPRGPRIMSAPARAPRRWCGDASPAPAVYDRAARSSIGDLGGASQAQRSTKKVNRRPPRACSSSPLPALRRGAEPHFHPASTPSPRQPHECAPDALAPVPPSHRRRSSCLRGHGSDRPCSLCGQPVQRYRRLHA